MPTNRLRPVRRLFDLFTPQPPFTRPFRARAPWYARPSAPAHVVARYALVLGGLAAPLRVVFLADVHAGSQPNDAARIDGIVADTLALAPDVILLGGDYVNMSPLWEHPGPEAICARLAPLRAPLGVYGALGNHDHEHGAAPIRAALEAVGVRVLVNEALALAHGDGFVGLVALDDERGGRPDWDAAAADLRAGLPAIVLAHDPASFARVPAGPHLVLAGHTHAGQIVLPGIGPLLRASDGAARWMHGLVEEEGRRMIVSAGLGCSGPPVRFRAHPEIVVIELA